MFKRIVSLVLVVFALADVWLEENKAKAIETLKTAVTALRIKRYLAGQAGKMGMEALFSVALLGIVLIIFIMKMAPSMFEASNEIQTATGTAAPDATSKTFMGMLPWIFVGIFTVVIVMVLIGYTKSRGRRGG
jgi:hypothetical protein